MFKKDEAKEEKHPATKAVMTARADVATDFRALALRLLEGGHHAPLCPVQQMAKAVCGCAWGEARAEAREVLGVRVAEEAALKAAEDARDAENAAAIRRSMG